MPAVMLGTVLGVLSIPAITMAAHIPFGSSLFEIEDPGTPDSPLDGANLTVEHGGGLDWNNVVQIQKIDTPSGSGDDAFGQGSKEDSPVPSVVSGSIPPNKSDLKSFGVYQEGIGGSGFLHLNWTRVQDPSGTTNMDFEFNQSTVLSPNGVTPVRTAGDLLIQYDLANGGTNPELFISYWITTGSKNDCEASNSVPCWGSRVSLSSSGLAVGSINNIDIDAADSELGALDARTFGEASIDLNAIFGSATECLSFGSAYLKSRSSDSFSAALKDFIAPVDIDLSNCANITIIKQDDTPVNEGGPFGLGGAEFTLWEDNAPVGSLGVEDVEINTCTTNTFPQTPVGECVFNQVLAGNYCVEETTAPAGHDLADPSYQCFLLSADQNETRTFTNPRKPAIINITKKDDEGTVLGDGWVFTLYNDLGDVGVFDEATDTVTSFYCSTTAGVCTIDNILPVGDYCLVETTNPNPGLYGDAPAQCFTLELGTTYNRTFVNPRLSGAIKITKTRKLKSAGGAGVPHPGVTFTVNPGGFSGQTDSNGELCIDNLLLSTLPGGGDYSVIETVPEGYAPAGATTKMVTVDNEASCSDVPYVGETVAFENIPLTNITITIDSIVDGGTETNVQCTNTSGGTATSTNNTGEDLTVNILNREPGTYTCVIFVDP